MKDDEELEMLLGEIPQATSSLNQRYFLNNAASHHHHHHHHHMNLVDQGYSHAALTNAINQARGNSFNGVYADNESGHHKYGCVRSPMSGYSFPSDGSSSSLLSSGGGSHSDIGSQSSQSLPQFEELNSGNGVWLEWKKASERNLVDDFNLSRDFSKMCVNDEQLDGSVYPNGMRYWNQSQNGMSFENYGPPCNYMKDFGRGFDHSVPARESVKINREASPLLMGMQNDPAMANLSGSWYSPGQSNGLLCQSDMDKYAAALGHNIYRTNMLANGNLVGGALFYPSQRSMYLDEGRNSLNSPNMVQLAPMMAPYYNEETLCNNQTAVLNGRNKFPSHVRMPQGRVENLTREDDLIIPREGMNYGIQKEGIPNAYNAQCSHDRGIGGSKIKEKSLQLGGGHLSDVEVQDSCQSPKMSCPFILPSKCSSLSEARGYIHHIAKNQQGCRILQKLFDEGTSLDVQIIFNEIIDYAVELMMNPFGNYLMQKLLEVCKEEERTRVLLKVTEEPGELIRICLNSHGTRVVQKLIEKLKTRQQISRVISALEPGFLTLIKDLNGNHVIQRCLECFTYEDSKFIFVAAAKHCVEIATHQHGCCVLQHCINKSRAEHREKLVTEISENGFMLAQDPFGNYVVQFVLDLKNPSITLRLTSQFEGKYVHLSTQKFSSHVVERCLMVGNDEIRSRIIHELVSAAYFDQLLQDPHANYVIQTALRISEGRLHMKLVDTVESYRAVVRNSPYSKRIFSNKLLKRCC